MKKTKGMFYGKKSSKKTSNTNKRKIKAEKQEVNIAIDLVEGDKNALNSNYILKQRELIIDDLLLTIGEDTLREGLQETPKRVAKFYSEFFKKGLSPDFKLTTFEGEGTDQMVCQTNIPFYSFCEHHMLPFFGEAAVAYIPEKRIIGLSKLARLVQFFAQRLQNQERLSMQIGECLHKELKPLGVGVVLRARHLCMEMRGVKASGTQTTTSYLSGVFKDEGSARAEFLELVRVKL